MARWLCLAGFALSLALAAGCSKGPSKSVEKPSNPVPAPKEKPIIS